MGGLAAGAAPTPCGGREDGAQIRPVQGGVLRVPAETASCGGHQEARLGEGGQHGSLAAKQTLSRSWALIRKEAPV